MSNLIKADRPGGFLDFLPSEYIAREKMIRTIARVFRSYGFDSIETPIIEFEKTLKGETGDTGKQIFTVKSKSTEREALGLRFDHTIPFARLLAANPYNAKGKTGLRLPLKRMVVGPVFRGERPQNGRHRQFYQFDADIAGSDSRMADAEIIAMMYDTLLALRVKKFTIKINNRKILNGLAQIADIKERDSFSVADLTQSMMRILDKIDKIGVDKVIEILQKEPKDDQDPAPVLSKKAAKKIEKYLKIEGRNFDKIKKCKKIFKGINIAEEGIKELEQVFNLLPSMEISDSHIKIDFSVARGLDYYTGIVMETTLENAPEFGSIFSGGRYNGLVSRFTGKDLPAIGTSIGLDRLFAALKQLEVLDQTQTTVTDVMVLRLAQDKDDEYLHIANEARKAGLNTEVCLLEDTTFKNQFNFALNKGVRYIIICGEDEFKNGTVQIKNLKTREQVEVSIREVEDFFEK